jgi:hypothetical protein
MRWWIYWALLVSLLLFMATKPYPCRLGCGAEFKTEGPLSRHYKKCPSKLQLLAHSDPVTVLTARNTKTTKPNSGTNPDNSAAIAQPIMNPGYHLRPPRTSHHITQVSRSIFLQYPLPHYYGILSFSYDHSINTILTYAHDTMLTALLIISGIPGHRNKLHVFKSSYC